MKINKLDRRNWIVFNSIIIVFYFCIFFSLKIGVNDDIMFSSPDSKSYLDVSNWIGGEIETNSTEIRPILYPLIIYLSKKVNNIYGVWFVQFMLWLIAINLIFFAVKKITGKYVCAYVSGIVIASNLSLIALTLHGLTEVTVVFLLALLLFFISKNNSKTKELYFYHGVIFILALLTIVKPVFFIPLLITLVFHIFINIKKYFKFPRKAIYFFIILFPLFTQLTIMKLKHDSLTVSKISSRTFNYYLFSQGYCEIENISREESFKIIDALSAKEKVNYLLSNFGVFISKFFSNIEDNIKAGSTFLNYPEGFEHKKLASFMGIINKLYFLIHLIFILPVILLFYMFYKNKDHEKFWIIGALAFLCYYFIIVTGVSFWQGDRLVLPSIALWVVLYTYIVFNIIEIRRSKIVN